MVGDQGQRFEVRAYEIESGSEKVIGWSSDLHGANKMKNATNRWPNFRDAFVVDRGEQQVPALLN